MQAATEGSRKPTTRPKRRSIAVGAMGQTLLVGVLFDSGLLAQNSTPVALLDTIHSNVKKIKATSLQNKGLNTDIKDAVTGLPGTIKDEISGLPLAVQQSIGLGEIGGNLKDTILGAVAEAQSALDAREGGLKDFQETAACENFRTRLGKVVTFSGQLVNVLLANGQTNLEVDFTRIKNVVNKAPCAFLFVVHRALDGLGFAAGQIKNNLAQMKAETVFLKKVVTKDCSWVYDRSDDVYSASRQMFLAGQEYKALAKLIHPSTSAINLGPQLPDKDVGIHGYAHMTVAPPKPERWMSGTYEVIGEGLLGFAGFGTRKARHCTTLAAICQAQNPASDACVADGF